MTAMDLKLIKMLTDHYWIKRDEVVDKILFKGRTFYNKFEKVNSTLSQAVINQHLKGEITVAHSLINKLGKVENIVIDYNGRDPERFYHKASPLMLLVYNDTQNLFTYVLTKKHLSLLSKLHKEASKYYTLQAFRRLETFSTV